MGKYIRSFVAGFIGFIALNLFYTFTMRFLAGSWNAAVSQFEKLWHYMIPLSVGFGIQVGLYFHLRNLIKNNTGKNLVVGNTATSAIGMVACCAHHLTDVLPFIGFTVISTLFVTYQVPLLIMGIVSNIIGIYFLFRKISKV